MPMSKNRQPRKRGPKRGVKRGPYKKSRPSVRKRVIDEGHQGRDWATMAENNGVTYDIARRWIVEDKIELKPRGG